jgi:hypothetical protein
MANLKIKNETVYVIYHNGQPYQKPGRKLVYTSKGAAKNVITTDAQYEARRRYENERKNKNYDLPSWWELTEEEREKHIDAVKSEFEVVEYGPKGR